MGCQQSNINASIIKKQSKDAEKSKAYQTENSEIYSNVSFEDSKDMDDLLHDLTVEEIDSHLMLRKATLEDLLIEDENTTVLGNLSEFADISPAVRFGKRNEPSMSIFSSKNGRSVRRRESERIPAAKVEGKKRFAEY